MFAAEKRQKIRSAALLARHLPASRAGRMSRHRQL